MSFMIPPRRAALIGQRREFGIGTGVDPVFERLAAGQLERRALQLAVLERDDAALQSVHYFLVVRVQ